MQSLGGSDIDAQRASTEPMNPPDLSFSLDKNEVTTAAKKSISQGRPQKNFFSRFIEGYQGVGREDEVRSERLTIAISEWFGRQGRNNDINSTNSDRA